MTDQCILITMTRYKELYTAELKLLCLEEHGVDNWAGYSDAMETYSKSSEQETEQ